MEIIDYNIFISFFRINRMGFWGFGVLGAAERWWCDSLHVYRMENSLSYMWTAAIEATSSV